MESIKTPEIPQKIQRRRKMFRTITPTKESSACLKKSFVSRNIIFCVSLTKMVLKYAYNVI